MSKNIAMNRNIISKETLIDTVIKKSNEMENIKNNMYSTFTKKQKIEIIKDNLGLTHGKGKRKKKKKR